jgi:MSHA biogenesis protein MshQ
VKVTISPTTLSTINATTLSTLNVFMSPWWDNGDSASYNQLVVNYFKAGGNLILLDDSTQQDGVAALLGIPTLGQADGTAENGGIPLFNGPFGIASNVVQSAQIGYLASSTGTASAITSRGGTVCGTNGSGQVTAACWAPGAYASGAGAMIIVADVDTWTTQASYAPLNSNGIFALNGTAYVIGAGGTTTPVTASAPVLSDWGLVGLAVLLIASAMVLSARGHRQNAA